MNAQKQKGQAANAANTQKAIDLLKVYLWLQILAYFAEKSKTHLLMML